MYGYWLKGKKNADLYVCATHLLAYLKILLKLISLSSDFKKQP